MTPPRVPPRVGMAQAKKLRYQLCISLTAFGLGELEELPEGEVAGMGRHKVEEVGLRFGVTEGTKGSELVRWEMHRLESQDGRGQLQVIADAA